MAYLLDWGIGSFLSVQGHGEPISTSPGTLSFHCSREQRCMCLSVVQILMTDSGVWSAAYTVCVCVVESQVMNNKTWWPVNNKSCRPRELVFPHFCHSFLHTVCFLLPDFPPSARRQQAEGFLWFHTGSWQFGLEPRSGPLDGWQTGVQLESKGTSSSVSRAATHGEVKHQGWRLSGLGGDYRHKNKQYTIWSNQNGSAVQSFHAALYLSVCSLMGLDRGGGDTPITIVSMVTRLAIHPGETEAEWMTATLAFTCGRSLVTMAFRSETTQRHSHALDTSTNR